MLVPLFLRLTIAMMCCSKNEKVSSESVYDFDFDVLIEQLFLRWFFFFKRELKVPYTLTLLVARNYFFERVKEYDLSSSSSIREAQKDAHWY